MAKEREGTMTENGKTNRFSVGNRVAEDGIRYEVVDCRQDGEGRWLYDIREVNGDGERLDVPEERLAKSEQ